MGHILADTAILVNLSKKESLCSFHKHTSWMGWLLKKEGFVCQENLSVNMQQFLKDSLEL